MALSLTDARLQRLQIISSQLTFSLRRSRYSWNKLENVTLWEARHPPPSVPILPSVPSTCSSVKCQVLPQECGVFKIRRN